MSLFQAFPSQKELFQGLEGMTKTEVPLVSPQPSFFVCCDWIRLCQLFTKLKFSSLDLEDWCDVCPESDLICLFTAHMCVLPLPIPCGPFSVQLGCVLESLPLNKRKIKALLSLVPAFQGLRWCSICEQVEHFLLGVVVTFGWFAMLAFSLGWLFGGES